MIEKLFDSSEKSGNVDTLIVIFLLLSFVVCTAFIWYWMIKLRGIALKGMEGENSFWEIHEQICWWVVMMMPPIVFKAAFISDVPLYVWFFLAGVIAFALFGRGVIDYFPFLNKVKKDEPVKVTTETTTETTIKP